MLMMFDLENCSSPMDARYQQEALEDVIEVDSLYATYAHDPKTGAESPRAIIMDGDLMRISITDSDRDRRDPVLITSAEPFDDAQRPGFTVDSTVIGLADSRR